MEELASKQNGREVGGDVSHGSISVFFERNSRECRCNLGASRCRCIESPVIDPRID